MPHMEYFVDILYAIGSVHVVIAVSLGGQQRQ